MGRDSGKEARKTRASRRPAATQDPQDAPCSRDTGRTRERQFDAAYYQRHYHDASTAVTSLDETRTLARFVYSYLDYLGVAMESVLDLGCGIGNWREALESIDPSLDYIGVEVSEYLCGEYGWLHDSVADYDGEPADLVICQGVLQYLSAREARRAIRNLARVTEGALYLEALTTTDWEQNCSQEVTDGDVHLRSPEWYKNLLAKHFISVGGGIFLPKDTGVVLFELERGAF